MTEVIGKLRFVRWWQYSYCITLIKAISRTGSLFEEKKIKEKKNVAYIHFSEMGTYVEIFATIHPAYRLSAVLLTMYFRLQDYVTDTYLRQKWSDPRLSHEDIKSPLDLADPNLVKAIWKPEVYFPNAKEANFQFVTVPNVLIRIHPNGEILYILRLVIVHMYSESTWSSFPCHRQYLLMYWYMSRRLIIVLN